MNKEVKKTKYVCGTNPNKCPLLSRFLVEHVSYACNATVQVGGEFRIESCGPYHQVFYASCMIKYDIAHDRGCNKVRDKCFKVRTNSVPKTCQTIKDQTAGIICANEILLRSEISPTYHRFMSHFIKTEDQYLSGARIKIR